MRRLEHLLKGLRGQRVKKIDVSESETLGLDITDAVNRMDWHPKLSCAKVLEQVVEFYKEQQAGESEYQICLKQIKDFLKEMSR